MPCAPRKSFAPKSPVKRPAAAAARAFAGRRAERDLLQNKRNAKPNAWLFFLPKAKKKPEQSELCSDVVPETGIEPARVSPPTGF